jgi:hypothetical protein
MAGGGVKGGVTYGETDDFSYNIVNNPVDVHDLHATILHCLGVDHTKLTYKFQGRHFRSHGCSRECTARLAGVGIPDNPERQRGDAFAYPVPSLTLRVILVNRFARGRFP